MHLVFEYDLVKSAANLKKHGIDFERAQELWRDPWIIEAPARTRDEPRFITVGQIDGLHWSAIWTPRGDAVRLISVRRARKEEIGQYESL
jgi:hypothetical protein